MFPRVTSSLRTELPIASRASGRHGAVGVDNVSGGGGVERELTKAMRGGASFHRGVYTSSEVSITN